MTGTWWISLVALILSAFFSGMEIAFATANKLRIELEHKKGDLSGRLYSYFIRKPSHFLATMLAGNYLCLVIFTINFNFYLHGILQQYFDTLLPSIFLQVLITSVIVLITAEFLPKNLFTIDANKTLTFFALPVYLIYILLYPVTMILIGISSFILRKGFNIPMFDERLAFGRVDLDHYVRQATEKRIDGEDHVEEEVRIFRNALDFSTVRASECMVPRADLIAIDSEGTIKQLEELFISSGVSKILVYEKDMDNIIGYIHGFELFQDPKSIREIIRPISLIPESVPANVILEQFIRDRRSIAVVVDEFGGTSGIITMEDIMEEIFGEIEDEHDSAELVEKKISETEYIFAGRLEIDYLNSQYGFELPESDEYNTLAGLMLNIMERIPVVNEKKRVGDYLLRVRAMNGSKIELIGLKKKPRA